MRSTASIAASIAVATLLTGPAASAQTRVEVGILNCSASSSTGYIIASTKYLRCHFKRSGTRRVLSRHGFQVRYRHRLHEADGDLVGGAGADRQSAAAFAERQLRRGRRGGDGGAGRRRQRAARRLQPVDHPAAAERAGAEGRLQPGGGRAVARAARGYAVLRRMASGTAGDTAQSRIVSATPRLPDDVSGVGKFTMRG